MSIVESSVVIRQPIRCTEVALQAGDGAELLSDFDVFARINAEAKVETSSLRGKMVLATRSSSGWRTRGPGGGPEA